MKVKLFRDLTPKQREKVKKSILEANERRKRQIEVFENALITPIKNIIEIGKKVLNSEVPVEYYPSSSSTLSDYLKEFLSRGRK